MQFYISKSKKEGKDQESIQSSTTPDPGYQWENDNVTIRQHKRELRGQPFPSRWPPQGINKQKAFMGPPGVLGIWGEWLFIFRDLGSTGNYFRGAGEQAHSFGDLGSPAKKQKKIKIKEKPPFCLIFKNFFCFWGG